MENKILKSVKDAEEKSRKERTEAEKRKEKILADARDEAKTLLKLGEQKAQKETEAMLEDSMKKIEDQRKKILISQDKEIQRLEKAAKENIDEAVKIVAMRFEEELNNA